MKCRFPWQHQCEKFARKFLHVSVLRDTNLLDSLLTAYDPQLQIEQINWLNEYSQSEDVEAHCSEEWANLPICSYRDGQINISDFLQIGRQLRVSKAELSDAERVEYILREVNTCPLIFKRSKSVGPE